MSSFAHADADDFFTHAPCGLALAGLDSRLTEVNETLLRWLGYPREQLLGKRFPDILNAGGRIHYETHFSPLLQMHGELSGITVDLVAADDSRIPVFVTANAKRDSDGNPVALRITAQDARDRRSYERELLQARRNAEAERERAQVFAATLQRSLVPPRLVPPEGLAAAAHYHTSSVHEVGGDFYDLFPLSRHRWGFFLGDVSGKGAGAAAVTSLTRYTLRAAAVYNHDPVTVLQNLNTVLRPEFHSDDPRYCTVIAGMITTAETGFDVELASGGHPPALLLTNDGEARYIETTGGQAVGLLAEPRFVSRQFHFAPGDTLVLYTDGLTEARVDRTKRFDDDNALLEFARTQARATPTEFITAVRTLLRGFGAGLEDDTAVLALGVPRQR
ncbi:PP2C family protein-serine/threonine phosphatase [Mycolicibacterium mengxianglii]|uniref:PP2C family protein-serine/threonine phosphatase n=1 Tax=Mycolicibacterium mengxianglii TaxID=2736649 RepID=UPI0018D05843|nr:SpoIIE family protein phosphatase [Mycolicibacterium mengxianglii]